MIIIATVLLGILTSYIAELVTAINKRLQNTLLKGDGAFLVALAISFVGAVVSEITAPGFKIATLTNWQALTATFTEVFAVSQVYFMFVVKKLNLDVQEDGTTTTTTTTVNPAPPAPPVA